MRIFASRELWVVFRFSVIGLAFGATLIGKQESEQGIRHSIVISGPRTLEFNESDEIVWDYESRSRDISKLDNGNYLIALRDEVVEVTPMKKVVWSYRQDVNAELMSAQRLEDGKTLVTELGVQPRLVEVDSMGTAVKVIPIQPETDRVHMQSRMGRKLPSGNYLVPHRIMPFAKEYNGDGGIVRVFRVDTPELGGSEAKNGTFAAARLADGSTVITCASGNRVVIFDRDGRVSWQLTSEEVDGQLRDVCGLQVLKSGNLLVSCYGNQSEDGLKMMEITRDKEVVWTYQNPDVKYVHTLQVITTNGVPE